MIPKKSSIWYGGVDGKYIGITAQPYNAVIHFGDTWRRLSQTFDLFDDDRALLVARLIQSAKINKKLNWKQYTIRKSGKYTIVWENQRTGCNLYVENIQDGDYTAYNLNTLDCLQLVSMLTNIARRNQFRD